MRAVRTHWVTSVRASVLASMTYTEPPPSKIATGQDESLVNLIWSQRIPLDIGWGYVSNIGSTG